MPVWVSGLGASVDVRVVCKADLATASPKPRVGQCRVGGTDPGGKGSLEVGTTLPPEDQVEWSLKITGVAVWAGMMTMTTLAAAAPGALHPRRCGARPGQPTLSPVQSHSPRPLQCLLGRRSPQGALDSRQRRGWLNQPPHLHVHLPSHAHGCGTLEVRDKSWGALEKEESQGKHLTSAGAESSASALRACYPAFWRASKKS